MTALGRLWRGEVPLAEAFWIWAALGGLAVNLGSSALFLYLISIDRPVAAIVAGYAPSLPYNLAAAVGVWRSAARFAGDPGWAALARAVTVAGMVLLSVT